LALALALFGGRQKNGGDKNKLAVRGDPHVLIVGEPGLGKSQMLQVPLSLVWFRARFRPAHWRSAFVHLLLLTSQ
jgi:hypothetical protein